MIPDPLILGLIAIAAICVVVIATASYTLGRDHALNTLGAENRQLRGILERAGLRLPEDALVRTEHADAAEATGSWTGEATRPEEARPKGVIPRWDERHQRS